MPNWCEMDLTVTGPKAELDRLVKECFVVDTDQENKNPRLDFDRIIPYPKKFKDIDALVRDMSWEERNKKGLKDGFNSGGYEWCCENWGTKWGACRPTKLVVTTKSLKQTFSTAWSPPLPIMAQLGKMFPLLTFKLKYFEGGMGFQGVITVQGDIIEEVSASYSGRRGG